MRQDGRKLLDRAFSGMGILSILLMAASLLVILVPIFARGAGAFLFRETAENRRMVLEVLHRGDRATIEEESETVRRARQPVLDAVAAFEADLQAMPPADQKRYKADFADVKAGLERLFGPTPWRPSPMLPRDQYGETRWDRALHTRQEILFAKEYDYSDPTRMGQVVLEARARRFADTRLEPIFGLLEQRLGEMMRPRWTFYARFVTDPSHDAHFFGGIGPEVLGTFYLVLGAMLFAVPMGVISAVYLIEYARENRAVRFLRTCVGTLAGVPSIVYGLFGLAFLINFLHVSRSKSVLAGSLTLGLLVLPTVIRASEEAIRAVPHSYKEAALSLGASRWRAVTTVILPAALPGILTGIVISMGRAAGETAPIIFTAAVSVGKPLTWWETFTQPTPALPWNIYNLCSEHEAVDEIRHVQYGMVLTLVALVLLLNLTAIILRARITRRLRA